MLNDEEITIIDRAKKLSKKALIVGKEVYRHNQNVLMGFYLHKNNEDGLRHVKKLYERLGDLEVLVNILEDEFSRLIKSSARYSGQQSPRYTKLNILNNLKALSTELVSIDKTINNITIDPFSYTDKYAFELKKNSIDASIGIKQMRKEIKVFIIRMEKFLKENKNVN